MVIPSTLDLIRRVPLLSSLTDEQARSLAERVVRRRFGRGEIVLERGGTSNALFVLLNGQASVFKADVRGREAFLARLLPGDFAGEMSLIDGEPHSASVRAEIRTDMLILGRADFAHCLSTNFNLSEAIMLGLVQRLRHANRQIESLALLDVSGRVAHALLDMARTEGAQGVIQYKVTPRELAKVVGASREMVGRVLRDLEARGMIQTQNNGLLLVGEQIMAM